MSITAPRASLFDRESLEAFRRDRKIDPHYMRRVRYKYLQANRSFEDAVSELPQQHHDAFLAAFQPQSLTQVRRQDSKLDGATKLALRTADGEVVETVLLRTPGKRISLCVSSQVGCAAQCQFCATGYLQRVRNLSAAEILSQVDIAKRIAAGEGHRIRNLVFMGMGEPFHNETAVHQAARLLLDSGWFAIGPRRTLVSTVGVPQAMVRWAREFPKSPLGLSLHSADQEQRESIIPVAKKATLSVLREALDEVVRLQDNAPVMIEYLMLRGVNDSLDHASQLADYLRGLPALINLIPFNPIDEAPHLTASSRPVREAFGAALQERGFLVKIRYSLGADIDAACGQLARRDR